MASRAWQHPYVNIFKHLRIEEWKKASKEGDVSPYMDKTVKCSVLRIKGSVPASNYILAPKLSTQSLGLTGRYFYLLFRPTPNKHFVVHLDVAAEGLVVRISFSSMFKEFKSTATWLQFPFICGAAKDSVDETTARSTRHDLMGLAPSTVRWTCLMMDLRYVLSVCLNRCHSHLKSVKLCANMGVKNMFTSDLLLDPGVSFGEAKLLGLASSQGTGPMPRDMSFPVPQGECWHDLYDSIRFPPQGSKLPFGPLCRFESIQKGFPNPLPTDAPVPEGPTGEASRGVSLSKPVKDRMSLIQQITTPPSRLRSGAPSSTDVPDVGVFSQGAEQWPHSPGPHPTPPRPPLCWGGGNGHDACMHEDDTLSQHGEDSGVEEVESPTHNVVCTKTPQPVHLSSTKETMQRKLQPDPILRLDRIIGFGGGTTKCALWTKSGDAVVYPCHAIIISMTIATGQQRFFIGHTDKVSALAFDGNTTVLASAQTGDHGVIRVWNYHKGDCLVMFRTHTHSVSSLSFSHSGDVLCGVGKDSCDKTMVVVWNTSHVHRRGEVVVLAKAHTDVEILTIKVAHFDDTRMVSCGRDNIRLWRVRCGYLRSCPVNLEEYHSLDFTDVVFDGGQPDDRDLQDRTLYASSRSGHIVEIDYSRVTVKNVRRLLPSQTPHGQRREKCTFNTEPGIAINSISVSFSFCATGSEDGFLRLWPLDFSSVFLEAEHEGPVSLVSISDDGLLVLASTPSGNLGYLDVRSRGYSTLMRSHTDSVLAFSADGVRRHLATSSSDGTVRIWNMDSLQQLYDFVSDDSPSSVAFHPNLQVFSCGFGSGLVRVFDVNTAKLLAEHREHKGKVVGLVFSPDGEFMYSAGSMGSLALYNTSEEDYSVICVLGNAVAWGTERAPDALTVSTDSRCLAFIGPSEYIVTVADARSLDELLHVDVSILDVESSSLDAALKVCFSPAPDGHLLVATSANKILWVSVKTGRLHREVSKLHKQQCASLAVSEDSRYLLTAGHNIIKVWDYNMLLDVNSQMFIGHSQPIHQLSFSPDQQGVISVGDAIFFWGFLADPTDSLNSSRSPSHVSSVSPPKSALTAQRRHKEDGMLLTNGMPRQAAPLPSSLPLHWDSAASQVDQEALGSLSPCDDPEEPSNVRLPDAVSRPSSVHAPSRSFLRITEMADGSPLNSARNSIMENVEGKGKERIRPDCYRHFTPRYKTSHQEQTVVAPQPAEEGLSLKAVIGYNGNGRGNMAWSPDTGLFAYTCGCVLVLENLHTGDQRHLLGHSEEISSLAASHDGQTIVSGSASCMSSKGLICIWNVQVGVCQNTVSYHKGAVQSLAFSRDDLFFLSIGDFSDPEVALWSSRTFRLLSTVRVKGPVHDAAFSPMAAGQLAFVGSHGVFFCLINTHGLDVDLKSHRVSVPEALGAAELTSLCYSANSVLFTGTNRGHICAWNTITQRCIITLEADEGEIGVMLCRRNRLLTGSNTRRLRLWETTAVEAVASGGEAANTTHSRARVLLEQEMTLDGTIVSAAFDDLMDVGIVGTTAGTLWYINWVDNSSIRLISGHKTKVNDVAFSRDESHFATCAEDGSVRVWSAPSNELVVQFQVLNQGCGCVCWSPALDSAPGSARVAAGYSDGTLRIFRLATSEMEMKLQPHAVQVTAVQYSTTGHVIISAGKNGLLAVSSPEDGATLRIFKDHKGAAITTVQCVTKQYKEFGLSGNDMWLAASSDRRVSVWAADWLKGRCELLDWLTFPAPTYNGEGERPPPSLAAFCPTDPGLVAYTGYAVAKELTFYSLARKQVVKKISLPHWIACFSLSSKAHLIAVGSRGRVLKLIESDSGGFQDYVHHSDSLHTCRFSPSGRFLFTVAYNEIYLWEVKGL